MLVRSTSGLGRFKTLAHVPVVWKDLESRPHRDANVDFDAHVARMTDDVRSERCCLSLDTQDFVPTPIAAGSPRPSLPQRGRRALASVNA
jgi:hypothetical protein